MIVRITNISEEWESIHGYGWNEFIRAATRSTKYYDIGFNAVKLFIMYERGEGEWRNTVKYEVKSLENNSTHCLSKLS